MMDGIVIFRFGNRCFDAPYILAFLQFHMMCLATSKFSYLITYISNSASYIYEKKMPGMRNSPYLKFKTETYE